MSWLIHRIFSATFSEYIFRIKQLSALLLLYLGELRSRHRSSKRFESMRPEIFKWIKVFDSYMLNTADFYRIYYGGEPMPAPRFCFFLRYQARYPVKLTNEIHKLYHLNRGMGARCDQMPSSVAGLSELDRWIGDNPFMATLAWKSALEVSIRSVNVGMLLLRAKRDLSDYRVKSAHVDLLNNSIKLLRVFRSGHSSFGNHTIVELAGLIGALRASSLICDGKGTAEEIGCVFRELANAYCLQVNDDGSGVEGSLTYLLLITECYLFARGIAKATLRESTSVADRKALAACEFIGWCSNSVGEAVRFGDDDSASLFKLCDTADIGTKHRVRNLFLLAGLEELISGDASAQIGYSYVADLYGLKLPSSFRREVDTSFLGSSNRFFENSGIFCQKKPGITFVAICDVMGLPPFHGHTHSSVGSFFVVGETELVIPDPGSFCYTDKPKKRNFFRSEFAHNSITSRDFQQYIDVANFIRKPNLTISKRQVTHGDITHICLLLKAKDTECEWQRNITLEQCDADLIVRVNDTAETESFDLNIGFIGNITTCDLPGSYSVLHDDMFCCVRVDVGTSVISRSPCSPVFYSERDLESINIKSKNKKMEYTIEFSQRKDKKT